MTYVLIYYVASCLYYAPHCFIYTFGTWHSHLFPSPLCLCIFCFSLVLSLKITSSAFRCIQSSASGCLKGWFCTFHDYGTFVSTNLGGYHINDLSLSAETLIISALDPFYELEIFTTDKSIWWGELPLYRSSLNQRRWEWSQWYTSWDCSLEPNILQHQHTPATMMDWWKSYLRDATENQDPTFWPERWRPGAPHCPLEIKDELEDEVRIGTCGKKET